MASGFRTADGTYADGSWELNIRVTDLPIKNDRGETVSEHLVPVLVRSEDSVGFAISRLVEALKLKFDVTQDWSGYEMWWPKKNKWLMNSNHALVREEVQADAELWFTMRHKTLRIQLCDLQYANIRVDFSSKVFTAVKEICRFFDIRRPEELSLLRVQEKRDGHKNSPQRSHANGSSYDEGLIAPNVLNPSMTPTSPYTPGSPMYNTLTPKNKGNSPLSANSLELLDAAFINPRVLTKSPLKPSPAALCNLFRPKSLHDKARRNMGWLDSSKSLMEQGVKESDTLLLRFKFLSFYDLNPKYDAIRVNQLFEQARWSLLCEEVDCTEEEMIMFASLQYHISRLAENVTEDFNDDDKNKDIDEALHELEDSLGMGGNNPKGDITSVPELADYIKYFKPKKLIKSYKKHWFTFKDTTISYFKSQEEAAAHSPAIDQFCVKGAEVIPDVNIKDNKYVIKLLLPTHDGMTEVGLRCDNDAVYSRWMAACKLAAKGRTMADSSYNSEVDNLKTLLKMQKTGSGGTHSVEGSGTVDNVNIEPEYFIARRHLKKLGNKHVVKKIQESVTYYNTYNSINAKLAYIKAWQALPEFGLTHFYVRFKGQRREELVAFAFNRLIRMDPNTGEALKTWRYNTMKEWSVNWESKNLMIHVAGGDDVNFLCSKQSPKLLHEFLGGYIFLSMRNKDNDDRLDEDLFHRLTGGSIDHEK
uniref:fermitin family homolog 2-like n=1 Tax=Styela clava TaxID=7725 RepID=UPI00193AD323|nr:fermitin family homolog 2-like [Styela clava]